jgi:CubicO group peptidase (beta-lactamase class C family)
LARLIEVIGGQRFDAFIQSRILRPLGMVDTGFVVSDRDRLVAFYAGADPIEPHEAGTFSHGRRAISGGLFTPLPEAERW